MGKLPTRTLDSVSVEVDPRIELAAERTMLAWVRTGLSMMGFGFVVARFGLFLREMAASHSLPSSATHGLSLWVGVALVSLGVATLVVAPFRYIALLKRLRAGQPSPLSVKPAIFVCGALAIVGAFMATYLVVTAK